MSQSFASGAIRNLLGVLTKGQATKANSLPVALASDQDALPVTDNGGSLTVDAPVGTPAFVRLSDGSAAISTLPVSLASVPSHAVTLAAGAAAIAKAEDSASADADVGVPALAVRKATPANTSGTDGDYEMLQMSNGRLYTSATIDAALPAGTNAIGKLAANAGVDIGDVTINNASGASAVNVQDGGNSLTVDGTVTVQAAAVATGGASKVKYAAQTTTVQTVKGSAGKLLGWYLYNPNSSVAYVQIFDVSGAVTLGTTAPDLTLGIPAGSAANLMDAVGLDFANAIKIACTTTATGSSAPSTGLDCNFFYK